MNTNIGQLFFIGLSGKELTSQEADFIVKNNIGGVVLFARNLEDPKQIHKLCTDVQNLRHKTADKAPIFISIDMEGGRVHRLKAPFTQWPAARLLGDLDSSSLAFKFAFSMGQELRAVGINLDFAPCVDIFTNPQNTVIGDRALGTDPEHVAKMASALVRGYIKADVFPCAKHFPGHGNTIADSHFDLPIEDLTLEQLEERELIPFKKAFRARLDFVMTAHMKFPKIDNDWPVTLSEKFIKHLLREELRYKNLIMTDDLDMKALRNHYDVATIPVQALKAGCDILLYCNEPESPPIAMENVQKALRDKKIDAAQVQASYQKILDLKKYKLTKPDPLPLTEATRFIGHPDHLKVAQAVRDGVIPADLKTHEV